MKKQENKYVTIRGVPHDVHKNLKILAAKWEMTMNEAAIEILQKYFKGAPKD